MLQAVVFSRTLFTLSCIKILPNGNNKREKHGNRRLPNESRDSLIKGVNHQVVEVTKPTCEYFERVIFFVKPEFSQVSEGTLRERAGKIAGETGAPPPTKLKRSRIVLAAKLIGSALIGAAAALLISRFF